MIKDELSNEYFEWLYQLVCDDRGSKSKAQIHQKLLRRLHNIDFTYIIQLDENRAEDGRNLRYRFGYEYNYPVQVMTSYLDNRPCSVLEMMIALAVRCEESIMCDQNIGNRIGKWFWKMISNLELDNMMDYAFNPEYVDDSVSRLLNREYAPNGLGGLFTVTNNQYDLRAVEIWYQLMWYLNEII